jgi:outer membrane receptor protein involved in Fe transport
MYRRSEINRAVCLALATTAGLYALPASAQIEEITVTATKRATGLQDTPVAIQALGQEQLDELNIANFDDYMKYLPNVNAAGRGPGQSFIFIRGMATDSSDQTSVEIGAPVPNVALYLDEQPVSSGGRNLDLYVTDIERIEVLPGPQGTLFGASSMAGTVRLITNKADYSGFKAGFKASYATTSKGDPSNSVEAYINIPVIDDRFAIRGAFYNAVEGGYIDNVLGENAYLPGMVGFPDGAESTVINNVEFVEDNFNDAVYRGARISARIALNDDWELIPQFMTQTLDVDGVFDHSPESLADLDPAGTAGKRVVGDLEVERFFPDWLDDEFDQLSLTVNGRLGALDFVYAGSFLDREVNNSFDYSGYTEVGSYGYYYICQPDYTLCGDPTQGMLAHIENERTTHEIRVSYSQGGLVDFVAGVFLDDIQTRVDTNFFVAASAGFFAPNSPHSEATAFNPNPRAVGITFMNDAIRDEEQVAVFGELTLNVTDQFAVTLGARNYNIETSLVGSSNFATPCPNIPEPCTAADDGDGGRSYDTIFAGQLPLKEDDTIMKASVSWRPNDDLLFFGTYSEGFRPGGFNRNEGVPTTYLSDEMTNLEFGWKTTLANDRIRFNGSIYKIDWDEMQIGVTDFENFGVLTFVLNAGNSEITGFEGDLTWYPTDQLRLAGSWSYNETEMVRVLPFVTNLTPVGSELALAPEIQFNVSARYEWQAANRDWHSQLIFAHTDDQFSSIVAANRFKQDSYDTVDGAVGVSGDGWTFELFGENLTDERAELFINALDTDLRVTTNRPRTFGIRLSYDF